LKGKNSFKAVIMKAGFVQFNPKFGKIDENIDKAVSLIEKADAELLVLPELFNTGYLLFRLAKRQVWPRRSPPERQRRRCAPRRKRKKYIS